MNAYKYLSEKVQELDKDKSLAILWEEVFKKRFKIHKDKKKAITSANAKVYSECFKIFEKEILNG